MSTVTPIRRPQAARKGRSLSRSVVGQVRVALQPANRLASFLGAILGGFVPLSTYVLSHSELAPGAWLTDPRSAIVAGGLLYSAKTVYRWGCLAFGGDVWKALGFVALTEGVMIMSSTPWLALCGLGVLAAINGVATAVTLSTGDNRAA